jgi:hypothetical protein
LYEISSKRTFIKGLTAEGLVTTPGLESCLGAVGKAPGSAKSGRIGAPESVNPSFFIGLPGAAIREAVRWSGRIVAKIQRPYKIHKISAIIANPDAPRYGLRMAEIKRPNNTALVNALILLLSHISDTRTFGFNNSTGFFNHNVSHGQLSGIRVPLCL